MTRELYLTALYRLAAFWTMGYTWSGITPGEVIADCFEDA